MTVQMLGPVMEEFEELLLQSARNGDASTVKDLLQAKQTAHINFNVNCKGRSKSNHSWTSLHLACYFNHVKVAEVLLQHGADVNVVNDAGDTPLHKAAFTGREPLVMLLLQFNADISAINGEGQTPKDLALVKEIRELLEGVEKTEVKRKEDKLFSASREGNIELLNTLLKSTNAREDLASVGIVGRSTVATRVAPQGPRLSNINCIDSSGNTALHCAAYREQEEVAVILLQNGIDSAIRNKQGQTALDLARSERMKQILDVKPIKTLVKCAGRFEGPLLKRSRFLGWQDVWVVLERGVLTYFKTRADSCSGVKRRGFKHLDSIKVYPLKVEASGFVVHFSDNTIHRLCLPTTQEENGVTVQKWMNALQDHSAYCTRYMNQSNCINDSDDEQDWLPLGSMQDVLQSSQAHHQVLENYMTNFTDLLSRDKHKNGVLIEVHDQLNQIRDVAKSMIGSLGHCLTIFTQQEEVRQLQLKQEKEKCRVLEDALHVLATEHHELEQSIVASPYHTPVFASSPRSPRFYDTSDDEFYDAYEGKKDQCKS